MLTPIELNLKNIRVVRQQNNNQTVFESITSNDMETFNRSINQLELERTLKDLDLTKVAQQQKCCQDNYFCRPGGKRNFFTDRLSI